MCSDLATVYTIRGSNPGMGKTFSLLRNVQTGSGAHIASSTVRTGRSFQGVRRRGRKAGHSPPSGASPVCLPSVQRDFSFFLIMTSPTKDGCYKHFVLCVHWGVIWEKRELGWNDMAHDFYWAVHGSNRGRDTGVLAWFPSPSTLIPGACV